MGRPIVRHEVVSWFGEGLRQLRDSKILDRYLEDWKAKQEKAEERARQRAVSDSTTQRAAEPT